MSRNSLPDWLPAFFKFYVRPDMPTLRQAWMQFRDSLPDPAKAPKLYQVRHAVHQAEVLMEGVAL